MVLFNEGIFLITAAQVSGGRESHPCVANRKEVAYTLPCMIEGIRSMLE
jgi:hypothetical protein